MSQYRVNQIRNMGRITFGAPAMFISDANFDAPTGRTNGTGRIMILPFKRQI